MRLSTGKVFALVLGVVALASPALFLARNWIPSAASRHARALDGQIHWTLVDSAVLFIAAQLLLALLVWSSRTGTEKPLRTSRRVIPVSLFLGGAFIVFELFSAATLGRSAWAAMYSQDISPQTIRVQAMGQQFAFYFRYPGPDGRFGPVHVNRIDASVGNYFGLDTIHDSASRDDVTSATLILPVDRPVEIMLLAQDVIHGFYVREMRVQQDMVPGMEIPVRFTPTRLGKFEIACSQLCGLGHYRMRAFLQVVSDEDFEKWMQAHGNQYRSQ